MAKSKSAAPVRAEYEQDWGDENQAKCPGYSMLAYEIAGEPYETMVRCDSSHPHQEIVKVTPGHRDRLSIATMSPISGLATEKEALWAIRNRQKRAKKEHKSSLAGVQELRAQLERSRLVLVSEDVPPDVQEWLASQKPLPDDKDKDIPSV